jgi:protein-disulfide isomerase
MKSKTIALIAVTASLALAGCGKKDDAAAVATLTNASEQAASNAAVTAPPAGSDWSAVVAATKEGGFIMGNPKARVKLLEYGALSCPHCAHFALESKDKLKAYIAKGTVSYELRTFLIHPQDVAASLLARCNGPEPFFAIAEQMFEKQNEWLGKSSSISAADQQKWATMTPNQAAADMAGKLGLVDFVKQRGVGGDKANACLADPAGIAALQQIAKTADEQYHISATPTFIINGSVVPDTNSWGQLEPALRSAGA